jgi:methyl-accepting chemotaxis protein
VHETGAALSEIVGAIGKIDVNVGAIVESAREQAIGLKEINTAVNQMDQGTQQNAATVEETTAANHSISDELAALLGMLAQFDVGDRRAAPAHATKTTARAQGRPLRVVASSGATAAQEWQEF